MTTGEYPPFHAFPAVGTTPSRPWDMVSMEEPTIAEQAVGSGERGAGSERWLQQSHIPLVIRAWGMGYGYGVRWLAEEGISG